MGGVPKWALSSPEGVGTSGSPSSGPRSCLSSTDVNLADTALAGMGVSLRRKAGSCQSQRVSRPLTFPRRPRVVVWKGRAGFPGPQEQAAVILPACGSQRYVLGVTDPQFPLSCGLGKNTSLCGHVQRPLYKVASTEYRHVKDLGDWGSDGTMRSITVPRTMADSPGVGPRLAIAVQACERRACPA